MSDKLVDDERPVSVIRMGQVLRDARPKSIEPARHGKYVNLYAATHSPHAKLIPFDAGINPVAEVNTGSWKRRPVILIASSPHKIGLTETPWQDIFDSDNGYVRYYGDNRTPGRDPSLQPGNRALLKAHSDHTHHDPSERARATPLLLFKRVSREGAKKGFVQFEGLAIITGVELITQFSTGAGGSFANFAFELLVFDLSQEHELLDLAWISARRESSVQDKEALALAPTTWRKWVNGGSSTLEVVRRRVSKLHVESRPQQLPIPGSPEESVLKGIYDYYDDRKARFEALAQVVAERIITPKVGSYTPGGLTRATADGGIDFIARLDIGESFGKAKLIVLGQAKCVSLDAPTNGNHIARTVARLRRGWLGVFVTTSYFSIQAQREVIEDRYPIVLICGRRLAREVRSMLIERGQKDGLVDLLDEIDADYDVSLAPRDPEELLFQ
jgi:hypothetical protein